MGCGETTRVSAISARERPRATRVATSRSRAVAPNASRRTVAERAPVARSRTTATRPAPDATRRADPARDRPGEGGERVGVALLECAAARAAGIVHGAPDAPADDERAAQFVGDIGRQEQVAVARAALRIAAGDVVEDADWHP